jgi:hypothetical protein
MTICNLRVLLVVAFSLTVGGCAAEISAALNRDLRTDTVTVTDPTTRQTRTYKTISVPGERRLTFFAPDGRVCPENFPDVGRSTEAKSTIDLPIATPASAGVIKVDDAFKTALLKTNDRTESADMIGRLGAIICVAYLNDAISKVQYGDLVTLLVNGSVDRLKKGSHTVNLTK